MALKDRQAAFVREYLACGNAAEAYRKAKYKPKSDHAAEVGGSRLLRNVEVLAAIEAGRTKLQDEVVSPREILEGLKREARGRKGSRAADRIEAWNSIAKLLAIQKRAELQAEIEAMDDEGGPQAAHPGTTTQPGISG